MTTTAHNHQAPGNKSNYNGVDTTASLVETVVQQMVGGGA
jgi:hypothetical protein